MKNIFYWSPCLSNIGTINSTLNSAIGLKKYFKENYKVVIINVCGEWDKYRVYLKKNNIEIWDLRGSPVVWLARKGWTKDRIKKGDEITVSGYPGHDGKKMLSIIEVKLSDGTILIDNAPK